MAKRFAQQVGCGLALASCFLSPATSIASTPFQEHDWSPAKVGGYEQCLKCHNQQANVLRRHPHFSSYHRMHLGAEAKQIASRLGIKSIKRSERCNGCHYTTQTHRNRVRAISGISCESCHGPAQDWIMTHNNYGGPNITRENEPLANRHRRIADSIKRGMAHPSHLYLIARNCFRCHVVDDEELVNVGGHPARSKGFNMVSWSQGKTRHNYLRSNGLANEPSRPTRLRVMYVVGLMTDLEYSIRATAVATANDRYGREHARKSDKLRKHLTQVVRAIPADDPFAGQLAAEAAAISQLPLRLNQQQQLEEAAERLSRLTWLVSQGADGSTWSALDQYVPTPQDYVGRPLGP